MMQMERIQGARLSDKLEHVKYAVQQLIERLRHSHPLVARLFNIAGFERKACVICNTYGRKDDFDNFKKCQDEECAADICFNCYQCVKVSKLYPYECQAS